MSAPTPRRPPAGGRDSPSASPSRSPRASTPSSGDRSGTGTATTPGGGVVGRTRSVRSSTIVSARAAAAAQRRESLLSNSTSVNGGGGSGSSSSSSSSSNSTSGNGGGGGGGSGSAVEAEEAARAETMALLDDLKARLARAETASEQYQRQNDVLQARLDEALREQVKLEERAHEYDEQTEALKNEKREMARQIQQMETIYEAERSAMTREKEDMANREEEMQRVIQRLKDSLAQRNADDNEGRPSRQSNNSPGVDSGSFAPPSSLHRSDSRNNSKLLLQKDKLIESLRLELAEAQIKLVESENQGGGRLHEVERQLMEARMANARLMEDNESYQLLLQERTLKGDFGTADFGYAGSLIGLNGGGTAGGGAGGNGTHSRPRSSNQDALNALEGRPGGGSSLADELSEATEHEAHEAGNGGSADQQRRLEAELKSLQDQNKALTLYINKIIERLLEHQDYQYILDKSTDGKQSSRPPTSVVASSNVDKDLPPPPPPQSAAQQQEQNPQQQPQQQAPGAIQSFFQRTKSMAVGGGASLTRSASTAGSRPRVRPLSLMPETALNNPDTAPAIPISLTRSTSVRRPGRPMSEQYTGGASTSAASVVNAMYKGSNGPDGPLSAGLRSPKNFFGNGPGYSNNNNGNANGMGSPGAGGVGNPLRSPGAGASGNFPGMKSETSSVSGESVSGGGANGTGGSGSGSSDASPPPNANPSPPRPHHEKTAFTGSKPRPLRLVQENPASAAAAAAAAATNKRASWIGWGGKKDDAGRTMQVPVPVPAQAPARKRSPRWATLQHHRRWRPPRR
ncbi:m serotype protein [Niveomyces insectorum RCEF 264]|uniref:M serotype protein n=1 Tax=Niveomyces insectorum RCEF 264 TaxID=1081102 RepID=A0A167MV25_9HYPO|nr:m serotype protein [Niveomyces insectorum RCEF 264]